MLNAIFYHTQRQFNNITSAVLYIINNTDWGVIILGRIYNDLPEEGFHFGNINALPAQALHLAGANQDHQNDCTAGG
jgi:hypothetical protein